MDANTCNTNHSNTDALLPPRKRLLAGLKRQNSDLHPPVSLPLSSEGAENEKDCLIGVYKFRFNNSNLSNEGIVEASRAAAVEAAEAAVAARINAEEKAAKAVKAVALAKSALELVAALSSNEESPKKNKMKKHVPLEALYNNRKDSISCRMDEVLARKLHQAINSSPRILKNSSGADLKDHSHKKLKHTAMLNGVAPMVVNLSSTTSSNGNHVDIEKVHTECPLKTTNSIVPNLNGSNHDQGKQRKLDNGEESEPGRSNAMKMEKSKVELILSNGKFTESLESNGKKRGKLKQKKLPLSICSFRDRSNLSLNEEPKHQGKSKLEDNAARTLEGKQGSFPTGNSGNVLVPVERTSMWKCQSLKAPSCVNKVMQS